MKLVVDAATRPGRRRPHRRPRRRRDDPACRRRGDDGRDQGRFRPHHRGPSDGGRGTGHHAPSGGATPATPSLKADLVALITYLTTIRFGAGVLAEIGEDLAALNMQHPLVVTDRGVAAAGLLDRLKAVLPARVSVEVFDEVPVESHRGRGHRGLDALPGEGLRRPDRVRRRLADRPREGGGDPGDPCRAARPLRCDRGWARPHHGRGRARDRRADHGRNGQRGRPRRADQPGRRAQARPHLAAPDPEARDLRSRTDPRPAAAPDRRDRHGCALPLHRDLPFAALQPARRGDRAGRRRPNCAHLERAVADGSRSRGPRAS